MVSFVSCNSLVAVCLLAVPFLVTVSSKLQPIVNVQTIPDGGIFNITCDASRVNIPEKDSGVTKILSLVVNVMNSDGQIRTPVAQYIPSAAVEIKNPPTGRNWIIDFSGYNNGTNNRNTMRIEILVRDAKCTDAGNYSCVVQYVSNIVNTQTMSQNVTAEAAIKEPVLTVNPLISGTNDSRNYTILSLDANNITMICRMDGPENLAIKWKHEIRPSMGNDISYEIYPYENDISTKPAEVVTSSATSCSVYRYESTLKFTVTERRRNYLCVGQMNNVDIVTTGFTVDLEEGGVSGQIQPIVNVKTIQDGGIFDVTCDASRVKFPPEDSGVTSIFSLTIVALNSSSQTSTALAQYLPTLSEPRPREIKNAPTGRNWAINFSGGNSGVNNRNTMKIEILVRDAKCTDAGNYTCVAQYFKKVSHFFFTLSATQNVTEEEIKPVVNVKTISHGGMFNITCDASRVTFPPADSGVTDLLILLITVMNSTSQTSTPVAQYFPTALEPAQREVKNIPIGRNWIIKFSGGNNGYINRNTVRIEILVRDARCTDAGNYTCEVYHFQRVFTSVSVTQNVTAEEC